MDAWAKVSVSNTIQAFRKAGIITEQPSNSNETDSDNDEMVSDMLDAEIAQLFYSDAKGEESVGVRVEA